MKGMKTFRRKATVRAKPMSLEEYVKMVPTSTWLPLRDKGYYIVAGVDSGWISKEEFEHDFEEVD